MDHQETQNIAAKLPLADLMKVATWDLHTEAETTGFINDILKGKASLPTYINFLQNLYVLYETMESSYDWLNTYPQLTPYIGEKTERITAIRYDLSHLSEHYDMPSSFTPIEVTRRYQTSIERALTQNHPAMLAHIYVRYLGDLNGGLILQRLLAKNLKLPAECLTFYTFPKIDDLPHFRSALRETLNKVVLSDDDKTMTIQAAKDAFRFNITLSKTLQP